MRLVIVGAEELHRVGRDDRQREAGGERDRGANVRLVAGQARALQLEIEAPRKPRAQPRRERFGAGIVAGQERAADRAAVGARQRDQAIAAFA